MVEDHKRGPGLNKRVAIIGAGFSGLVAAGELRRRGADVMVFESTDNVGGLATSFKDDDGFSYDFGAHFITNRLAAALGIGDKCTTVKKHGEAVYIGGRTYSYPYGLSMNPRFAWSAIRARVTRHKTTPKNAGDVFRGEYGDVLTDEIVEPLIRGWSGESVDDLASITADKIQGGLVETAWLVAAARVTGRAVAIGYSGELPQSARVWHVYPDNGLGTLIDKLVEEAGDTIRLESPVDSVTVESGRVVAIRSNDREWDVDAVFSTAPVHVLPRLVSGDASLDYLRRFRYRPMVFVNLQLEGRHLLETTTNWFPDRDTPFFRISESTVSMPWLAPEGKTILTADYGCEVGDATWTLSDEELAELTLAGLERYVPDVRERFLGVAVLRTPVAYPVLLNDYEVDRQRFAEGSGIDGLYSIGRNGEFSHILLEDVYWRTMAAVERFLTE